MPARKRGEGSTAVTMETRLRHLASHVLSTAGWSEALFPSGVALLPVSFGGATEVVSLVTACRHDDSRKKNVALTSTSVQNNL